jgi:membrane protease YdiL (CAAX protease family)
LSAAKKLGYHIHGNYHMPAPNGAWEAVGLLLFLSVVAPVWEEMFFRWFAFGELRDLLADYAGTTKAVLIVGAVNAVVFTLLHETADPLLIAVRLLGAAGLVYAYQKGGLISSIADHAFFNFLCAFPVYFFAEGLGYSKGAGYAIALAVFTSLLIAAWLHDHYTKRRPKW